MTNSTGANRQLTAEIKPEVQSTSGTSAIVCIIALALCISLQGCGELHAQDTRAIEGTVRDSLRGGIPLEGATIWLRGTDRWATTDRAGHFRFAHLLPRRYELTLQHESMDSLGLVLPVLPVDLRDSLPLSRVELAIPTRRALRTLLCRDRAVPTQGALIGRVIADSRLLAPLRLAIATANSRSTDQSTSAKFELVDLAIDGTFVLCGISKETRLILRPESGSAQAPEIIAEVPDGTLHHLVIQWREGFSGASARISSSADVPLPEAKLSSIDGTSFAMSDKDGLATLRRPRGTQTLLVTAVGYAPQWFTIDLRTDTIMPVTMRPITVLPSVFTRGQTSPSSLLDFEKRRQTGMGTFLGPQELEQLRGYDFAAVLANARGVTLGGTVRGKSMPYLRGFSAGRCIPNYFVDGVQIVVESVLPTPGRSRSFAELEGLAPSELISAVEIYASPVGLPPEYDRTSSTGCGSILIWTKRRL